MPNPTIIRLSVATILLAACAGITHAQSEPQVEEKRALKRLMQPLFPELARKLNLTGTAKIEVTIAPDGTVKRTRIVGGHPLLASAAESAAQKSMFQPGPRETTEVIEFKFSAAN